MREKHKAMWIHSIQLKIQVMAISGVVTALVLTILISLPYVSQNFRKISQNYLLDQSRAYGTIINDRVESEGAEFLKNRKALVGILKDVKLSGVDSSYAYLVSIDRTMLYHPTTAIIGLPVENAVVNQLIDDLSNGIERKSECIDYEYKQEKKYASIYINPTKEFILVVTADDGDIIAPIHTIQWRMIITGLIVILILNLACIIGSRSIVCPLRKLTQIVNKVAKLDLTENEDQRRLNHRKDEVGMISSAISNLHNELTEAVQLIQKQSVQLNRNSHSLSRRLEKIVESVTNVNHAVGEIAQGSTSQAQETSDASERVFAMGEAVDNNTNCIRVLKQSVDQMNQYSKNAKNSLEELMKISEMTTKNIHVVDKEVNDTNESAVRIQEAVRLIRNIAEQTNLLALNASIEAARAGDAGLGFSVVAEEIRRLSESSNESTKVIDDIVQELIRNSEESVACINELNEEADLQIAQLKKTNEIYDGLEYEIGMVFDTSNEITEQNGCLNQIRGSVSQAVEQLSAIAQQNAAATQETNASIESLSNTIEDCKAETTELFHMSEVLKSQTDKFAL